MPLTCLAVIIKPQRKSYVKCQPGKESRRIVNQAVFNSADSRRRGAEDSQVNLIVCAFIPEKKDPPPLCSFKSVRTNHSILLLIQSLSLLHSYPIHLSLAASPRHWAWLSLRRPHSWSILLTPERETQHSPSSALSNGFGTTAFSLYPPMVLQKNKIPQRAYFQ